MADQGRWFKLWVSAISDPDLRGLSLEDFGRWCAFGAYLKVHGREGYLECHAPALPLQELLRLPSFEAVVKALELFPNCHVEQASHVTNAAVTLKVEWRNWQKYQADNSADRTRKWREKRAKAVTVHVTPIEEKRRDEKRRDEKYPPLAPLPGGGFDEFWEAYPRKRKKDDAMKAWKQKHPPLELVLAALEVQRQSPDWLKNGGQFIPYPGTWLRAGQWQDEIQPSPTRLPGIDLR